MTEKKNNFLPLLLVGGGVGVAALLIAKNSAKPEEDISILGGGGVGGSGDFFGNSESLNPTVTPSGGVITPSGGVITPSGGVPMSSTPVIMPMLYPDSVDAGIEDIARDDVNLGLTDPSSGGVNPNNYAPSGVDVAQELALYAGATAAVSAAGYGVKKAGTAIKNAGTKATSGTAGKVTTSTAGKVANTATEKAAGKAGQSAVSTATKAAGTTAGKVAGTVAKGAGVLGVLGAVDMFFDVTGVKDAFFSQGGLTGNLQGVNTSFSVNTGGITTDKQTSNEVGNMAYDSRQLKIASGLAGTGSTFESITAEETRIVNEALGTTGDVIKQSYSDGGYSYIGAGGKQLTFAGTDLKTAASKYTGSKSKTTTTTTSATPKSSSSSGSSSGSGGSVISAVSSFFSGLFGGK